MPKTSLLHLNDRGLYCPKGDFYIDPWKPVQRALITHAHGDHSSFGHGSYLAHRISEPVMRLRLGADISLETVEYKQTTTINGVSVSFFPAGHIPGSSQIRLEYQGEVWVVSGDYKLEYDGLSTAFETVPCHTFISEATFGIPIYRWKPQAEIFSDILEWWQANARQQVASILFCYSLGKAQRLLAGVGAEGPGPVYAHGAVYHTTEAVRAAGLHLPPLQRAHKDLKREDTRTALILAPPSAFATPWLKRFLPYSSGSASGWMAVRGIRRRKALDRGFILSDHADWADLNKAIKATGAERVFVTHGSTSIMSRWLNEQGIEAHELSTHYSGDEEVEAALVEGEAS